MISKERLQELIKEKATIYFRTLSDVNEVAYNAIPSFWKKHWEDYENWMYETEEDAKWELEMTATRTEILRMPPFIEVCDGCIHDITFIDNKKCKWQLTISDNGIALLDFALLGRDKFWNKLTKENYISACKLCLRLFKGEEV